MAGKTVLELVACRNECGTQMIDVEQFYRRYGPMVLRRCRFMLRDEEKARDAMQEVFVQILRRQDVLEATAPSSLLYRIATNTCLNVMRSERRRPERAEDELLATIAGVDDPAERALSRHLLDGVFSRELESTRTMAVLHYVDGMTLEETADTVGLSVSGVRKRLRGLRKRSLELKEA
jgi:RNA polymerase sigma factor (sigma-70 family)